MNFKKLMYELAKGATFREGNEPYNVAHNKLLVRASRALPIYEIRDRYYLAKNGSISESLMMHALEISSQFVETVLAHSNKEISQSDVAKDAAILLKKKQALLAAATLRPKGGNDHSAAAPYSDFERNYAKKRGDDLATEILATMPNAVRESGFKTILPFLMPEVPAAVLSIATDTFMNKIQQRQQERKRL